MIRASTKLAFTLNAPLPSRPYDAPLPSCDGKSFAEVLSPVIPMYKRELFEVGRLVDFSAGDVSGTIVFTGNENGSLVFDITVSSDGSYPGSYTFKFGTPVAGLWGLGLSKDGELMDFGPAYYSLVGVALSALVKNTGERSSEVVDGYVGETVDALEGALS